MSQPNDKTPTSASSEGAEGSAKEMIRVVAAEIEEGGSFLLTQRRPHATFPLYWEFPSGRVEEGESDEDALARELKERLGVSVSVGECTMFVKHEYEDYTLDFYVYRCLISHDQAPQALKVNDWRWVHPQEMESYPFPPADADSIKRLLEGSGGS
jgi:8-oxo-dGTP diphosphatase